MVLIVDSGSTKSDWLAVDKNGNKLMEKIRTKGLNPAILSEKKLVKTIKKSKELKEHSKAVTHVFFYGAGCGTENPRTALKGVLEEIFENGLMQNADEFGNYFKNELEGLKDLFPDKIKEIRGLGFMIGVEMNYNCTLFVEKLMKKNVLANCTNKNVLRLLPPLITTKNNIDFFLYNFHEILKQV